MSNPAGERTTPHYLAVDALRGVAALAVAVLHAGIWTGIRPFPRAYLAVDFFLMLSGFVLSVAYRDRLRGSMSLSRFTALRVFRLYPMLALGAVLGFVANFVGTRPGVLPLGAGDSFLGLVGAIACVPVWVRGNLEPFPINFPEWSLFFELIVGLVFGAWLFRLSGRQLLACAAGASIVWLVVCRTRGMNVGWVWGNFAYGPVRMVLPFLLGMIIFEWRESPWLIKLRLPLAACAALLLMMFAVPQLPRADWIVPTVFVFGVSPVVLISAAKCTLTGVKARIGSASAELSYPLYLVHLPLFSIFLPRMLKFGVPALASTAIAVVVVSMVGWLLHHLYDQPVTSMLRRLKWPARHSVFSNCANKLEEAGPAQKRT